MREPRAGKKPGDNQYDSFPGGSPGEFLVIFLEECMEWEGGKPGMPWMPGLNEIFSDLEVLATMQDPEVMVTFQDVAQNPANMSKYQGNSKVMKLISKLRAKFGGQA